MQKVIKTNDTIIKTLYDFRFDMYFQYYKKIENSDHWLCYLINDTNELHINLSELLCNGNLNVDFVRNNNYNNPQIISIVNNPKFEMCKFKTAINIFDDLHINDICVILNDRFLTTFIPIMEKLL
jgi:hypothetical protein